MSKFFDRMWKTKDKKKQIDLNNEELNSLSNIEDIENTEASKIEELNNKRYSFHFQVYTLKKNLKK